MTRLRMNRCRLRPAAQLATTLVLGGCTSFSIDGGFGPVQQTARERLVKDLTLATTDAEGDQIAQRVAALLARPLSADDAVQVALLNNRGLQASCQDLGITEAEVVQAGLLANRGFSFNRPTRDDEIVPLRLQIAEENVLRYNGVLIGVVELLADARLQIASVNGPIAALRDFWLAQADLDMALIGQPTLAAVALGRGAAAADH
jgi:hypothetical protein